MKYLSGPVIPHLYNTNSLLIDIKYSINYLLYIESKINIWNISVGINVENYDKVVVPLSKIANTECLL